MKKKFLLSSIVTIILCFSIIVGGTFALFTDETALNVAVTAGNVDIEATYVESSLRTWSLEVEQPYGTFENGGTAELDAAKANLTLDLVTPGDKIEFAINIANHSNVDILYRVLMVSNGVAGAKDLTPALTGFATINGIDYAIGSTQTDSEWAFVDAGLPINQIIVTIEFPDAPDNNDYKNAKADITFLVQAVQGNANVINLGASFEDGGYISAGHATNVITEDGVMVGANDVILEDIDLIQTAANEGYAVALDGNSGSLTLNDGAIITGVNGAYAVVAIGSEIVLNEGSVINASGANAACIMVTAFDDVEIHLNGSGLLNAENGAYGIWVLTGIGTVRIYVENTEQLNEYQAMLGSDPSTVAAEVIWFVNGVQQ